MDQVVKKVILNCKEYYIVNSDHVSQEHLKFLYEIEQQIIKEKTDDTESKVC